MIIIITSCGWTPLVWNTDDAWRKSAWQRDVSNFFTIDFVNATFPMRKSASTTASGASVDPNGHYYETNWTIDKLTAHEITERATEQYETPRSNMAWGGDEAWRHIRRPVCRSSWILSRPPTDRKLWDSGFRLRYPDPRLYITNDFVSARWMSLEHATFPCVCASALDAAD